MVTVKCLALLVLSFVGAAAFWEDFSDLAPRIVGGTAASTNEFPYFARWGGCGATLIWPDLLLSAAHCSGDRVVHVGGTDRDGRNDDSTSTVVNGRVSHPNFESSTFDNDFVILKLGGWIDKQIVTLSGSRPSDGEDLTVVGFGLTSEGGQNSNILRKGTVNYINTEDCARALESQTTIPVNPSNILCAMADGVDSCTGDSGGPILYEGNQIGIISWGVGCAREGLPAVYSWTGAVDDWIQGQICSFSEDPPASCAASRRSGFIRVDILYDEYPEDTSWNILDSDLEIIARSSSVTDRSVLISTFVDIVDGMYTFEILDANGDGFEGGGGFELLLNGEEPVLTGGGDFGYGESIAFAIGEVASTPRPTETLTNEPSFKPTRSPTENPTPNQTTEPTSTPSAKPTKQPSLRPTIKPTTSPTPTRSEVSDRAAGDSRTSSVPSSSMSPTQVDDTEPPSVATEDLAGPSNSNTESPSVATSGPTLDKTSIPTLGPTIPVTPTFQVTEHPSMITSLPTEETSDQLTTDVTDSPSSTTAGQTKDTTDTTLPIPTKRVTGSPSTGPTGQTEEPDEMFTEGPTGALTDSTSDATVAPLSKSPTDGPTLVPRTKSPTDGPTLLPTLSATASPTQTTQEPTREPTVEPSPKPVAEPVSQPTRTPTISPTQKPSKATEPSRQPVERPSRPSNSANKGSPSSGSEPSTPHEPVSVPAAPTPTSGSSPALPGGATPPGNLADDPSNKVIRVLMSIEATARKVSLMVSSPEGLVWAEYEEGYYRRLGEITHFVVVPSGTQTIRISNSSGEGKVSMFVYEVVDTLFFEVGSASLDGSPPLITKSFNITV